MGITIENVLNYLIETRLIEVESLVDGDLDIIPITGRNQDFKIVRKRKRSYFIKSAQDSYNNDLLRKEAQLYSVVQAECNCVPLKELFPDLLLFDAKRNILIVDVISNGKIFTHYYRDENSQNEDNELSATYGKTMAIYHNFFKDHNNISKLSFLPKKLPLGLFIFRPGPEMLAEISPANLKLLKIIQQHHEFRSIVTDLQAEWCTQTLIHGDIRWENVIVFQDANNSLKIKLVDWENGDLGDPAWDIAGALQGYISLWLFSLSILGPNSYDQIASKAKHPLPMIQSTIRAFWSSYTNCAESTDADELLRRAVKYAAIRLVQTAYEMQRVSSELLNTAVYMLQTSANILADEGNARVHLLGIPFKG